MNDSAHVKTDQRLHSLERKISGVYREAKEDMAKTVDNYFSQFEKRDKEMRERLEAGEIDKEYYKQWRLNQIGRGERFRIMRDALAERYTKANEIAMAYINDDMPYIYSLNRNYANSSIESSVENANGYNED